MADGTASPPFFSELPPPGAVPLSWGERDSYSSLDAELPRWRRTRAPTLFLAHQALPTDRVRGRGSHGCATSGLSLAPSAVGRLLGRRGSRLGCVRPLGTQLVCSHSFPPGTGETALLCEFGSRLHISLMFTSSTTHTPPPPAGPLNIANTLECSQRFKHRAITQVLDYICENQQHHIRMDGVWFLSSVLTFHRGVSR